MRCSFCKITEGEHNHDCTEAEEKNQNDYFYGYSDGSFGRSPKIPSSESYKIGHEQGFLIHLTQLCVNRS